MPEYFLPIHIYFCYRGEALVFLDLKRDDYVLVNGDIAAALRILSAQEQTCGQKVESVSGWEELLESGLLTTDRNVGKNIVATSVDLALERLVDLEAPLAVRVSLNHLWNFTVACTIAALRLSWQRLESIVNAVEQRKTRRAPQQPMDLSTARELTAIFQRLRYFFPLNYLCLYDSLALLEFLARYRTFPTWVFGVKLEPWAAHCWVQEAGLTFNEGVEEAANYTPVMAI